MKKLIIIFIFLLISSYFFINNFIFPLKYKDDIILLSNKYEVSDVLVASVICAESSFNKKAISNKGAMGLMQLMPSTAEWIYSQIYNNSFEKEYLLNEKINIELGCFYLNYLNKKFSNIENVLCAYNAGETLVREWLKNKQYSADGETLDKIPYMESENYVKKVKNYIKVYALKFK